MLSGSTHQYVSHMLFELRALTKLVSDCAPQDEAIIQSMDARAAKIMKGKKIHTLGLLAKKYNYSDVNVARDMAAGFRVTGIQPFTGTFQHHVKIPDFTPGLLRSNSATSNAAIVSRVRSSGSQDLDSELWNAALAEEKSGWLFGPFDSLDELTSALGERPHLCRRFPLVQNGKLRPIDDLSEPGTNGAFGSHDKLNLMDADVISAIIRQLERVFGEGLRQFILSDGEVIDFAVHPSWLKDTSASTWHGRTLDLEKAYKQLVVHVEDRWAIAIAMYNPVSSSTTFFGQVTIPFGASGAVLAFNRPARLLWFLGATMMNVVWSNFFDDYPTFSPLAVCKSVGHATELLFSLLGWRYSTADGKYFDFARAFAALGLVYELGDLRRKPSSVSNKPARVEKFGVEVDERIRAKSMSIVQGDSMRGKVQYMETAVFGRAARAAFHVFNRHNHSGSTLDDHDIALLKWIWKWLSTAVPRYISSRFVGPPLLLFSDGACEFALEIRLVTFGGLLYDPRDAALLYFGDVVTDSLEREWSESGKAQLVTEAEIFPQLIARRLWRARLHGANVISFLDSEPAKFCCIKGSSDSESCSNIVRSIHMEDAKLCPNVWYTRVPSYSNPIDAGSRLDFNLMAELFPSAIKEDISLLQPTSLKEGFWVQP